MTEETTGLEAETGAVETASTLTMDEAPNPAPAAASEPQTPAKDTKADPSKDEKERNREGFGFRERLKKEQQARERAERELEQLRSQRPAADPAPLPHPGQDPEAFYAILEQRRVEDRLERSEDRFIDRHSQEAFEDLKAWMFGRDDLEAVALRQRDPWGYVYQLYQREKLAAEIGDDPAKWRESERARLRAELEAEMAAEGYAPQPAMTPQPRQTPTSAASARSASPNKGRPTTGPAFRNNW